MSLERIVASACELGEGPIWHADENRLYWVDIDAGRLHRYDPVSETHDVAFETSVLAGVTIQRDGSLLLFMDRGRVGHFEGGELTAIETVIEADSRFNDVIVDPRGRVFCGTMPTKSHGGKLYRLDVDGTTTQIADGIGIPNGMGFTEDHERFYFTETEAQTIYRFNYEATTGELSERQQFIVTPNTPGFPDGMTVDSDGNIWSARWEGGCLVKYDSRGDELARFDVPTAKVTSVTFGGENLDSLYITTAGGSNVDERSASAGAVFRLDTDASGRPEFRSDVHLS